MRSSERPGRGNEAGEEPIRHAFKEAAALYGNLAEQLLGLVRMFPFPAGGEPNDPANAARAVAILQSAKALEERAVTLLERMQELSNR